MLLSDGMLSGSSVYQISPPEIQTDVLMTVVSYEAPMRPEHRVSVKTLQRSRGSQV